MKTRLQSTIKLLAAVQAAIFGFWLVSYELFVNFEVAFITALIVMMGSMYSYSRLVTTRLEAYEGVDEKDLLEKIDDPYDLYDDETPDAYRERETATDAESLKSVIKEEKERLKGQGTKNLQKTAPAVVSVYRMIPYVFLVLGFIGLKNNGLLSLWPYMAGLGVGIVAGFFVGRNLFISRS